MLALEPRFVDLIWTVCEPRIPVPDTSDHPLGTHRKRIPARRCLHGILLRLALGCSWKVAALLVGGVSSTTLRRRRTEWVEAGVFAGFADEAIRSYDRIVGLDLSDVSIDGSIHKAPCGGDGTGPNPTDRGKRGWKWSLATDRWGIPVGWVTAAANTNDCTLVDATLDAVDESGLVVEIETLHLDKGYDSNAVRATVAGRGIEDAVIARRRKRGEPKPEGPLRLGMRWSVERTNSWISDYGQMRRNTDRVDPHRAAQLAFAIAIIITIKLAKWSDRWN